MVKGSNSFREPVLKKEALVFMKKYIYIAQRCTLNFLIPIIGYLLVKLRLLKMFVDLITKFHLKINKLVDNEKFINDILNQNKLIALDVGGAGGFNSDQTFLRSYEKFFSPIMVEPVNSEAKKLKEKHVISNALWSSNCTKNFYLTENNICGSSMYKPSKEGFQLYYNNVEYFKLYKITRTIQMKCLTLDTSLNNININELDYLKLDTQGAEYEILKGIGNFRPLLLRIEAQIFPLYENVPDWIEILNKMKELGYMPCEWEKQDAQSINIPAEIDIIFVPNYLSEKGKKIIFSREKKFISLMLIFGQISLLKIISNKLNFINNNEIQKFENKFHK